MEFRLLGPMEVVVDDRSAKLGGPTPRAVLAMLALAAPGVVSTDRIVDGVWGENPPETPIPTLQVFVHRLRKALGVLEPDRELIVRQEPGYVLAVAPETTDVSRFERLVSEARDLRGSSEFAAAAGCLEMALALWRGEALADLRESPFAEAEAVRLDEMRLLAQEDSFDLALALGRQRSVISALEERVHAHPTRERFWGQLMTALYRSDRQADALAAYGRARDQLAEELGIDPGQALKDLEIAVLQQNLEQVPVEGTTDEHAVLSAPIPLAVAPRPSARVPTVPTPTFGRAQLVEEVVATLAEPHVRVVTLTGPGGSGKSRVAALAARGAEEFLTGVAYLAVNELTQLDALLREIVHLVSGGEAPETNPLDGLAGAAGDRAMVLVLDNLEILSGASDLVADVVARTSQVTVLVTSRLPLRLSTEHEVPVPPLEVPGLDDAAVDSPSVQLFDDRARAADSRFELALHLAAVVELCRFLDGVPLALELAAARVRLLTPPEILAHLQTDLGILSSIHADVPNRQQTLTTTIQWSYDRLSASAQLVCDRLALFEGGFTVEAVEAVNAGVPAVLEALGEIVDARLIRSVESRVSIRLVVLGTVRAFARARLDEHADLVERRELLATYLLGLARGWHADLDGPTGAVVLGRFDDESADVSAAIERATDQGRHDVAVELVEAVHELWIASGRLQFGLERVESLLACDDLDARQRAAMYVVAGKFAYHLNRWTRATETLEAALDLVGNATSAPDRALAAAARCYLGGVLVLTGDPLRGGDLAGLALAVAEEDDLYATRVVALSMLAISAAVREDWATERERYQQRLVVVREREDRARISDTLNTLAEIALDEADVATAEIYARESLAIAGWSLPLESRDAQITLARAMMPTGDFGACVGPLLEALRLSDRTGQTLALAQSFRVGGCVAGLMGDHALAVRLFGSAQSLSPSHTGRDEPVEHDFAERLQLSRAALGDEEYARHWSIGITLPTPATRAALDAMLTEARAPD